MIRPILSLVVLGSGLSLSAQSLAQNATAAGGAEAMAPVCSKATMEWVVNRYLAAQERGDPTVLPLSRDAAYVENMEPSQFSQSILQEILSIDFHRTLYDLQSCQTFTEVIVTEERHPYVLGIRMDIEGERVTGLEAIVTDENDWLFDADVYLEHSPEEDWGVIAAGRRDSRATLLGAANAYFDAFMTGDADSIPFATPCNRLEGGVRTGEGTPQDSCAGGVPSGIDLHDRRFVVDEEIGAVVGFNRFGEDDIPDTHLFRVEDGKIRYVHTMTVCIIPDCGFID